MKYQHTSRPGFLLGFIDFFTAGLFFLFYMQLGLQDELESVLGHKLEGLPARHSDPIYLYSGMDGKDIGRAEETAVDMGIEGPHTSWWHMFGWNTFGILLMGPAVATHRFFRTLNRVENELNQRNCIN